MIINTTKNTILAKNFTSISGLNKIAGLLKKSQPETLVFKTRFGIHTFFLKFPIDLLVLDKNNVVRLAKTVRQNQIVLWNIKFNTVIELPLGTINRTRTKKGDIIKL